MELKNIRAVYFVGAGGIGMSAIARYFMSKGVVTAGYDRTPSELTRCLEREGMLLHYEEDTERIPHACRDKASCLVVYTPAVPAEHKELAYFRERGYEIQKRAEVLGTITRSSKGLCVAGTHGKTTTSAMCAHIMRQSHVDCNAFLGGISKNYGTNCLLSPKSDFVVVEADEFDRSFHHLSPWMTVITSTDADHLDIYGTKEAYVEAFAHYTSLIQSGGALIVHDGLEVKPRLREGVRLYTYGGVASDFRAENVRIEAGTVTFDFVSPIESICDVRLGQPIPVNVDNGTAAMAMAQLNGCTAEELIYGMATYKGVERRFDFKINTPQLVFLSDYAHHPNEIRQCARSLKQLYGSRTVTVIFQPHLYSRTRDFHADFAAALGMFDEVVLCDIYPAREAPIEGITSETIYADIASGVKKALVHKDDVLTYVSGRAFDVLVVLGAGDLDDLVPAITTILTSRQ